MSNRILMYVAAGVFASVVCLAEDNPARKPKTQKVTIPKTTVQFTLVQIPAGKIVLKDKEGKEKEFEVKPIWVGQTEVTWDEYDVFWLGLDLPEKDREKIRNGPSDIEFKLPNGRMFQHKTYEPMDRGWGHEGFPAGSLPCIWAKRY